MVVSIVRWPRTGSSLLHEVDVILEQYYHFFHGLNFGVHIDLDGVKDTKYQMGKCCTLSVLPFLFLMASFNSVARAMARAIWTSGTAARNEINT
jgi:hypothetical protein